MPVVEVRNISKSYTDKQAVSDLSFTIEEREIIGLIGPNGAGKSTSIKIMLDFMKPDTGEVKVFGKKMEESTKNRIGYLPEERGLYFKQPIIDLIYYFASLKGMDRKSAKAKADELLDLTGMQASSKKYIDQVSKGMAQVIQFIITIIHSPDLIIMDEPFSGLDPVNSSLLKKILTDLKNDGKSIMLSTHQMNEVEELCDRVLMINKGKAVLYGNVDDVRAKYKNNSVFVDVEGDIGDMSGVTGKLVNKNHTELMLDRDTTPQQILNGLIESGLTVNKFELSTPSLNEIFLKVVKSNE